MVGFLFAMLAVLAVNLGARDQVLVARLAPRGPVLAVALLAAAAATVAAGLAGQAVAPLLPKPARSVLVAMALALAALELLVIRPGRKPAEPTPSLGAFAVVVLAQQLTDAARFLVFAIAAGSPYPLTVIAGGLFGSAASLAAAWSAGAVWDTLPLTVIRRVLGAGLLAVALWLALPVLRG